MLSETLEPDGHLPGFKDGLAAFPPLSDWAELMVVLKLKGEELTRSLVENASLYHARWFTTELGDRRRDSSPRHSRLLSQQYLHWDFTKPDALCLSSTYNTSLTQHILSTGKRYRTKKERMRMEKGGPPLAADGSIDYAESRIHRIAF